MSDYEDDDFNNDDFYNIVDNTSDQGTSGFTDDQEGTSSLWGSLQKEGGFTNIEPIYDIGGYKQEVHYRTSGPTDQVEGISKTAQRILKAGKENAFEQATGILNNKIYDDLRTDTRNGIVSRLKEMKNLSLFRLEFLIIALIFVVEAKDEKNYQKFIKKYKSDLGENGDIDVYKYIRYLEKIEK